MLDELILQDLVQTSCRLHPLRDEIEVHGFEPGVCLTDIVEHYGIDDKFLPHLHVVMSKGRESAVVPPQFWDRVYPHAGTFVAIYPKVEGPAIGPLLAAVVSAAAPTIATSWLGLAAGTFAYSLAVAAITVVGSLLVNALIPPPAQLQEDDANFAISGTSNPANHYGRFPTVLGRHRLFMWKTASGYTETDGEDIFYHGRLTFGYGPVALEDLRIGTTSILEFEDVEIEFRNVDQAETEAAIPGIGDLVKSWLSGEDVMSLYPDDIAEDPYQVSHEQDVEIIRETRDHTSTVSVDTTFNSLVKIDGTKKKSASASFDFAYRLVGDADWIDAGSETYEAKTTALIRFTKRWELPVEGRYQIKVTRTSDVSEDLDLRNASLLTAIRSIKSGSLPSLTDVAEMTVRIRANEQLQGQLDQFNAITCQMAPVWDGAAMSEPQKVRHPAWVYARALMGPFTRTPRTEAQVHLDELKAWADEEPHWTCDYVVSGDQRLADILDIIAASGRAKKKLTDLKYSVLRDGAQGPIVGHMSPRLSRDFSGQISFPRQVHGFIVKVISERDEWQTVSVTVYADGYDQTNATDFETLELPGVVLTAEDDTQGNAWRLGRYHLAVHFLRPETFTQTVDLEHLSYSQGSKLRLTHDVPMIGLGQARIKSLSAEGGYVTIIELDDHIQVEDGQPVHLHVRGQDLQETTVGMFSGVPYLVGDPELPVGFKVQVPEGSLSVGDHVIVSSVETATMEVLVNTIEHSNDLEAEITLVPASPAVLDADQGEIPAYDPQITYSPVLQAQGPSVPDVDKLQSDEDTMQLNSDGSLQPRIRLHLRATATGDVQPHYWQMRWRVKYSGDDWLLSNTAPISQAGITSATVTRLALYEVEYRTIGSSGNSRGWYSAGEIEAKTTEALPPYVERFAGSVSGALVQLQWDAAKVADIRGYEIRFSPDFSAAWAGAAYLDFVAHPSTRVVVPGRPGRYLIRAVDFDGNYSASAATFEIASDLVSGDNVVETLTCEPTWAGVLTDVVIDSDELKLDTDANGFLSTGVYESGTTIDLGEVYPCGLLALADVRGFNSQNVLANWLVLAEVGALSGDTSDKWGIVVEVRTTSDDPAASPVWSGWRVVDGGSVLARAFQLRITLNSYATNVSPVVSGLTLFVDMPDRVDGRDAVAASSGSAHSVVFSPAFRVVPAIVVTPRASATGDYFVVSNESRIGFDVEFFNSSDTSIAATFDWVARGYGKETT